MVGGPAAAAFWPAAHTQLALMNSFTVAKGSLRYSALGIGRATALVSRAHQDRSFGGHTYTLTHIHRNIQAHISRPPGRRGMRTGLSESAPGPGRPDSSGGRPGRRRLMYSVVISVGAGRTRQDSENKASLKHPDHGRSSHESEGRW